jgi:hypothetical protein
MKSGIGWIGALHWIEIRSHSAPPSPGEPRLFKLTPEMTQYGVIGYIAGESGSISWEPFPFSGSVLEIFADDAEAGLITIRFSGDAYNILVGTSLRIDGVLYVEYDEPNYDPGDNVTDVFYIVADGAVVLEEGVEYEVEFIKA